MNPLLTDTERDALQTVDATASADLAAHVRSVDLVSREHRVFSLLPDLEGAAERFGRAVGWLCTKELRQVCASQAAQLEVLPGARVRDVWGDPRFLYGLSIAGQPEAGLIAVDAQLGSAFVVCQFGGEPEIPVSIEDKATVTELRTVSRLAERLAATLTRSLQPALQLEASIDLAGARKETERPLLSFAVEVTFGEIVGRIHVGLDTSAACFRDRALEVEQPRRSPQMLHAVQKTQVELTSVLGRTHCSVRRVMSLKPGDLLVLDTPVDGEIPLLIAGRPKFVGTPVLNRGSLSLRITNRVKE
jgi:flagellar motor switch protein FliM